MELGIKYGRGVLRLTLINSRGRRRSQSFLLESGLSATIHSAWTLLTLGVNFIYGNVSSL